MVSRLLIPLLCTGAVALACGPRSHPDAIVTASTASRSISDEEEGLRRAAQRARRAKHDGELKAAFAVDTSAGTVRFALAVENAGLKTLEMHFADGQTHDIVVLDAAGKPVWRWAEDRMFTQAHRTTSLAGGDTLRVDEAWDAGTRHGTFTAVATIRSTNYPLEQRASFELP